MPHFLRESYLLLQVLSQSDLLLSNEKLEDSLKPEQRTLKMQTVRGWENRQNFSVLENQIVLVNEILKVKKLIFNIQSPIKPATYTTAETYKNFTVNPDASIQVFIVSKVHAILLQSCLGEAAPGVVC